MDAIRLFLYFDLCWVLLVFLYFRNGLYVCTFGVTYVIPYTYVNSMLFDVSVPPITVSQLRYFRSYLVGVLHYSTSQ